MTDVRTKIEKLERLAVDPAATPHERASALRAIERLSAREPAEPAREVRFGGLGEWRHPDLGLADWLETWGVSRFLQSSEGDEIINHIEFEPWRFHDDFTYTMDLSPSAPGFFAQAEAAMRARGVRPVAVYEKGVTA